MWSDVLGNCLASLDGRRAIARQIVQEETLAAAQHPHEQLRTQSADNSEQGRFQQQSRLAFVCQTYLCLIKFRLPSAKTLQAFCHGQAIPLVSEFSPPLFH